ncbi:MAG TPA: hypothetical protein VL984_16640 [Acidimicrobiales bacterium]|nr:hypothetical protein [Acidimicrobiales bacterium]
MPLSRVPTSSEVELLAIIRNELDRLTFERLDAPLEPAKEWTYLELCRQERELLALRQVA